MGKNTKPMLTVLVEGDKLQQFRDYALSKEVSMGWVVNRLLDRVLSGELDVMGDTVSTGTTREYTSTGLAREDVETMIESYIDNQLTSSNRDYIEKSIKSCIDSLGISSASTNDIEKLVSASIEIALEPIKESVSKLEVEVRAINDHEVVVPTDSIAKDAPLPRKAKPNTDEPEWVNTDNRRFYNKLIGNSELLAKVAEAIDLTTNNTVLAESLVGLGFHKQIGKQPLGSDSISRIRKVVGYMRQAPKLDALPLFPN
jgi:hypothetical protein